ncbi:MAG: sigma factor-like helix-turn-helix DNA-binding protein [Clostridia bacterium]|nr:sigma factor-like helix-turn-helix DNA-binding protein [Clostridia bacterium]
MDRIIELGQLLDYYGAFLTERQLSLARQAAFEDCSLAEIAEREGISRQAVRDALYRAEKQLRDMEARLRLIERARTGRRLIAEARSLSGGALAAKLDALEALWEDYDGV